MLPYKSERSVKKLMDALPLYQDKLYEEKVFKHFNEILGKAKKAKDDSPDYKDFEAMLAEHKAKGTDDVALERKVGTLSQCRCRAKLIGEQSRSDKLRRSGSLRHRRAKSRQKRQLRPTRRKRKCPRPHPHPRKPPGPGNRRRSALRRSHPSPPRRRRSHLLRSAAGGRGNQRLRWPSQARRTTRDGSSPCCNI
jgi:hypothetical protein